MSFPSRFSFRKAGVRIEVQGTLIVLVQDWLIIDGDIFSIPEIVSSCLEGKDVLDASNASKVSNSLYFLRISKEEDADAKEEKEEKSLSIPTATVVVHQSRTAVLEYLEQKYPQAWREYQKSKSYSSLPPLVIENNIPWHFIYDGDIVLVGNARDVKNVTSKFGGVYYLVMDESVSAEIVTMYENLRDVIAKCSSVRVSQIVMDSKQTTREHVDKTIAAIKHCFPTEK